MWEKIVLNLLSNALKFTLRGAIAVTLHADREGVRLSVRDSGAGIPPEQLGNLFQRFHRVQGTEARSHEGSGIGLALIDELVKLHGGKVYVSSSVGHGSTFTVTLPYDATIEPAEPLESGPIVLPRAVRTSTKLPAGSVAPDPPDRLETIHLRHHDVHENELDGRRRLEHLEGRP